MSIPAFTVFQDEDVSATLHSSCASSSKITSPDDISSTGATKENINPLTGLSFDAQPPLKKRKPSSSSALKVKALSSSSKPASKSKKLSVSSNGKDKGKKRSVLGANGNRNRSVVCENGAGEAEALSTALGNRRAYEFTVVPLANVTQAYDESEATRAVPLTGSCDVDDMERTAASSMVRQVTDQNDIVMCDMTSKDAILALGSEA